MPQGQGTTPPLTGGSADQPMTVTGPDAPMGTTGTGSTATGSMPCDISQLAVDHCQLCHSATPRFNAPMPLVTLADFHAPAPSDASRKVYEVAAERINRTDNARMPPASSAQLAEPDLTVFNAWLDAGALSAQGVCETGVAGSGGQEPPVVEPPVSDDPDLQCYEFLAHAPGDGNTAPYQVGRAVDAYFNFAFNAPWQGMHYAKSFRVIIDNDAAVHHWLFYKNLAPHANAGSVAPSIGAHPDGELVHGWAPGGEDLILTDETAIEMPPVGYTLEFHYNSDDPTAVDASGLEICVTPNAPAQTAAISWLGTDAINGTTATGTCTPTAGQRIRILGGTPHMHTAGRHMKVEILRQGGQVEVIHDAQFDFEYQRAYEFTDRELWLEPGESIRTTCTYSRPVSFGEGTGDEMCYFFTLHYPALALTSPGLGAVIHGPNTCGVL